jgi:2-methylisocitrate lyase-like PEP mutase family enzyme
LQERLERLAACGEAGADAVWVSALSEDDIKAYAKVGRPMVGVPPRQVMTVQRYGELGGRVGCIPTVLQVAALHGMRQCLEELKRSGTETRYFKETPGIELKELEAKYHVLICWSIGVGIIEDRSVGTMFSLQYSITPVLESAA